MNNPARSQGKTSTDISSCHLFKMVNTPLLLGMKEEYRDGIVLEELIDDITTMLPTSIERDERYSVPFQCLDDDW